MRGLTLLLAVGLAASDKLDRTYLPPPGAKTSGGDLGAVDAPFEVPKESPSTTIRPRLKYPVKPEDTQLTVGINRGQPTPVVPQGFTTPGPFSPTYIPSTTTSIAYTQTTTFPPPEGFETTVSPIGPTGFPSTLRPVYGPDGQVIGVTPTPGTIEVCEEGNGRCQKAQQVGPVYVPKGQIIGQQPTGAPTQGTVQDLQPVYGPSGEIIGVTPTPGTVEVCKEGDERCQKQAQQNVPVYGPNGQIVGYQPSVTSSPGKVQGVQPVYGPNGQIIGQQPVTPTPGTIQVCKEGDVQCQNQGQQVPIYGPNGQIVGYQPSIQPTPGTVQSPSTQQQTIPVYGPNGEIVGYQPSVIQSPGTAQSVQPIYGPYGQIIGRQPVPTPTSGSVQVCNEGDEGCLKQAQQNIPVYGPNGKIVGYQPSTTPTPGTVQSPNIQGQQTIPVYGPNGEIVGYQPSVTPTPGAVQNLQPVYDSQGKIIEYRPTGLVQGCKEGDSQCQKQAQQYIPAQQPTVISTPGTVSGLQPVYDSNGKIIDYRPIGLVQGCKEGDFQCQKQAQQVRPVYGPSGQVIGQQPRVTPTPGTQSLQPVYDSNGNIIEYRPSELVQGCKEGDVQCQKQAQQYTPAYESRQQPTVRPTPGSVQGLQPVYDSNGKIIEYRPTGLVQGCKEGDLQCQKQAQQYIPAQQPSVITTPGTVSGLQPVYDSNGKIIEYRPSGLVQGCKEGDLQCQKPAQQVRPVYGPSGQIIGQQPSVTPTPGTQDLQPVYDSNGKIIEYRPIGLVQGCKEGDLQCQKQAQQIRPAYPTHQTISKQPSFTPTPGQQIVPVYGPDGQIIGQRPASTPIQGTVQSLQPIYSPSGQYVGQQPTSGSVQICQEGDQKCQKQQNLPVYGPNGRIVGYQPSATPTLGTVQSPSTQGQQTIPVYGPNGEIVGYQPSVTSTPGSVQTIQPTYGPGQFVTKPTQGIVQVCQNGDEGCQKQAEQNVPVYGPNGQIVGYQPKVTPTPGAAQDIQPVYGSNGKIIGYQPTGLVQGCKEGDTQCQKQTQQIRPVYGPNGQIIGQQDTPSPETVQSLRPIYGPDGEVIAHTPTVSPTTSRPVYEGKIYRPGSTAKPSVTVTTPSYYRPSSVGSTPAPFGNLGTTPAGVVISTVGPDAERPLAESDKKAVTINYDISITPEGYAYNFDTSNGIHVDETGRVKPDGNKATGSYSYIGDDGKEYRVSYEADENGFKPTGEHLPTPPPIPPEIQRVIEQAAKDKQAGISDDGSYDEEKYGPHRYERPQRPQSGELQRPTTGRKPSKQSYDKNVEPEEGYQYAPPEPKFTDESNRYPPRLPGRGDSRQPQGTDKGFTKQPFITPNVHRDDQDSYEGGPDGQRFVPGKGKQTLRPTDENVSDYDTVPEDNYDRPGGPGIPNKPKSRPNVTTYRPSGIVQPGQIDKFGRPISSLPGEVIGSATYRPSVRPQTQEVKFRRPNKQQPGEDVIENGEPIQVDQYGRATPSIPGQGYSTTTYRPTVTGQPTQVDKFGKPIYGSAETGKVDEYGRPTRPGQGYSSTTYRPTESEQPAQLDKFGRPIYSQPEKAPSGTVEPGPVDAYGRPTTPQSGKGITSQPTRVDKYGRPIYSRPEYEPIGTVEPEEVDKYGRPIPSRPQQVYSSTTYRPTETSEPGQIDAFGRPISPATGQVSGTAEPGQIDQYGRPIPSRPSQGYSTTTYRPTGTSAPGQVDAFGRPVAYTPGNSAGSTPSNQVDEYGRPIYLRPGQPTGVATQPNQVDKFGRPIYSQPRDKPSGTAEPSQVDRYGRPIPSRPEQGYSPTDTTGSGQLDAFGRPVSNAPEEIPGSTPSSQVDANGRPISSRPRQRPSSTYRPVETAEPGTVDASGRPVAYTPGQPTRTTPSGQGNYGRPISSGPRQQPSSTTYRPVSSTQGPEYKPDSGVSGPGGKPEEFGPKGQKVGPEYLSPYEDKNGKLIGEDFRGPKQPPRFDPKTGYHY